MFLTRLARLALTGLMLALLVACQLPPSGELPTAAVPATIPAVETAPDSETAYPTAPDSETAYPPAVGYPAPTEQAVLEPTAELPAGEEPALPEATVFDLGETTIIQANFPEDSRFREMPVRLNGLMSVPDAAVSGAGPYPVVLIFHGTHPGCPLDDMGVDRWPCDPAVEQPNYSGFEYLVRELAARGYVALSININAESTFGFGEPVAGERFAQIIEKQLTALAEAAAGGANNYGVELAGVPDMQRIALFGHSRGGELAAWLAGEANGGPNLAAATTFDERGYGPVGGLLLIAPATSLFFPGSPTVPLAAIVSRCDGDVVSGDGQFFFEVARHASDNVPVTTVTLAGANHNGFNTILGGDLMGNSDRPDCETLLDGERQRAFLVEYAADFLTILFNPDAAARQTATGRLGMDVTTPAPSEVLGLPALVSALPAAADRQPIFSLAGEADLTTNALGGAIVADELELHFCPAGFYSPTDMPGTEPCRRMTVTVPGQPALAAVSWTGPTGVLRFELPEGRRDLTGFTTLSLLAAVDPLSPLNAVGATQRLGVRLTDGAGETALLTTRVDEPALAFPLGMALEDAFFGERFSGLVPMTTIRLPMGDLSAIDLTNIVEIAIVFDQSLSGALFIGDLELIRPPQGDVAAP